MDRRESFSSYGAFVDLTAPGGGTNFPPPAEYPVLNILSLHSGTCGPVVCADPLDPGDTNLYLRRAGTSMAAAHVSGVAALILAADPSADLDTVRRRLFGNAKDLGPSGLDAMFGWGRLDAGKAIADSSPYALSQILQPAPGATVGGPVRIAGTAAAHELDAYTLEVGAGASPTAWTTTGITVTGGSVVGGALATWDTTTAADGPWTLRLSARDVSGLVREARRTVTVDNTTTRQSLALQVTGIANGQGAVVVHPPAAFCANAPGATESCSHSYPQGATVTLTAGPDLTSAFEGWTGACTGTGPCTVSMTTARNVTATFRGPYHLSIVIESQKRGSGGVTIDPPAGAVCPGVCDFDYAPGTRVTLSPGAGPVSSFYWDSGPCTDSSSPCTITMDRDYDLKAIVVGPDYPPNAFAGFDQTVELGSPAVLDGSWSIDPDGDPIWLYEWYTADGTLLSNESYAEVLLPLGVHNITLTVWSGSGAFGQDSVVITVVPPAATSATRRR
jgi:hypothetical protein